MQAAEYWAEVPPELRGRMHYFNVPCDTAPNSSFNPLNIIKAMYRPGDFVVVKLDIDTEVIEQVRTPFPDTDVPVYVPCNVPCNVSLKLTPTVPVTQNRQYICCQRI